MRTEKKFQLVHNWIFISVWNECRNGYFKKPVEINKGSVEETLMHNSHHSSKLELSYSVALCSVYLFKNYLSQFLNHWESVEIVFLQWGTHFLPCKNQNKSLTLSSEWESSNFAVCWYINVSSTRPPLTTYPYTHFPNSKWRYHSQIHDRYKT